MAEYDAWAEYYDLIHKGVPGEAEFYVGQAVRIGGRSLELGCGTGRIAIPMAMSGVDVTGLDNSKEMLSVCRARKRAIGKTPGRLKLVQKDMRDFELDSQFDFIAMPYRAFMHLLTPDDQRGCLGAVRRHLADEGVFIVSLWAAKSSGIQYAIGTQAQGFRFVDRYPVPGTDRELVHYCSCACNEFAQRLSEEHLIHEVDKTGSVLRTGILPLVRTWITPREMGHLLQSCGFFVEALFGDFECTPFSERSTEMIWVLRKAGYVTS